MTFLEVRLERLDRRRKEAVDQGRDYVVLDDYLNQIDAVEEEINGLEKTLLDHFRAAVAAGKH
jgi:DNA-binding FrmR family transcriptional regulator